MLSRVNIDGIRRLLCLYVTLQGRPRGSPADARDFVAVTDRLIQWVEDKALFHSHQQEETVLNVLHEGRRVFSDIAEREIR